MVFLLGRMGNNRQALTIIIERMGDVNRVSPIDLRLPSEVQPASGYRLCEGAE